MMERRLELPVLDIVLPVEGRWKVAKPARAEGPDKRPIQRFDFSITQGHRLPHWRWAGKGTKVTQPGRTV